MQNIEVGICAIVLSWQVLANAFTQVVAMFLYFDQYFLANLPNFVARDLFAPFTQGHHKDFIYTLCYIIDILLSEPLPRVLMHGVNYS